ncbi:substrate-binding periplasmic protein [Halopseudomonas salegens]|uniref:Polar amino acid transport system substrate-binding protein n=1 Tax=Halopseudomonas salegens TaxID=1434072 RepID=A0A1H2GA78_9GAMM|nr:transporter substrate-binding domain-containing protein [Halopseudomonas salegens]SDU16636.1 polar amino acid transport system substrate-binding protein [Halopseudomonas salegens]
MLRLLFTLALTFALTANHLWADSLPLVPDADGRHRITVGLIEFPPYSYTTETGDIGGLFIPLMEQILDEAGFTAQFRMLPISRLSLGLQDGAVHLWPGIDGKSDLRDHTFVGDQSLAHISINLYHRKDSPAPVWPDALHGQEVIMLSGYDYSPGIMQVINSPANQITPRYSHQHEGAVGMLLHRRANFLINYQAPMQQLFQQQPELAEQLRQRPLERIPLQMVVSRQAPIGGEYLLQQLEQAYSTLRTEQRDIQLPDS